MTLTSEGHCHRVGNYRFENLEKGRKRYAERTKKGDEHKNTKLMTQENYCCRVRKHCFKYPERKKVWLQEDQRRELNKKYKKMTQKNHCRTGRKHCLRNPEKRNQVYRKIEKWE